MGKEKPKIEYKKIKTQDSKGNRFVYSEDDGSIWVYDNHMRDGYGIYTKKGEFIGGGQFACSNFKYLIDKLNKYYNENQAFTQTILYGI